MGGCASQETMAQAPFKSEGAFSGVLNNTSGKASGGEEKSISYALDGAHRTPGPDSRSDESDEEDVSLSERRKRVVLPGGWQPGTGPRVPRGELLGANSPVSDAGQGKAAPGVARGAAGGGSSVHTRLFAGSDGPDLGAHPLAPSSEETRGGAAASHRRHAAEERRGRGAAAGAGGGTQPDGGSSASGSIVRARGGVSTVGAAGGSSRAAQPGDAGRGAAGKPGGPARLRRETRAPRSGVVSDTAEPSLAASSGAAARPATFLFLLKWSSAVTGRCVG